MSRIHELKRQRADMLVKASTITAKDTDETPMSDDDAASFDSVMADVAALDKRITRLEALADAEADSATPAAEDEDDVDAKAAKSARGGRMFAEAKAATPEPGFRAARYLIGQYWADKHGTTKAAEFVQNRFGDTVVAKALNATGSDATQGGNQIPQAFSTEVIELLRPNVAVRAHNPTIIQMPAGKMTLPRLASGATATYQGELVAIAPSQPSFDTVELSTKKLTTLIPTSNDLLRRASTGVEAIIRDDMVRRMANKEDLAYMRGDGLNGFPSGLLTLTPAANKIVATGRDLTAAISLVTTLMLTLQNGNSNMYRPGWIFNPTVEWFLKNLRDNVGNFYFKNEMDGGKFYGLPYQTTTAIPNNLTSAGGTAGSEIYLADFSDVVIGDTYSVGVEVSREASYVDGGNTYSAFQNDMTLFRAITENDLNTRHPQSLAVGLVDSWKP